MADILLQLDETILPGIANAIKDKTGKTDALPLTQFAAEIESISGGSGGGSEDLEAFKKAVIARTITEISMSDVATLGDYAFGFCTSLSSASFPACTNICTNVFFKCSNLSSFSASLCTTIGNFAFGYCTNLSSVDFPECTTIGSYAFSGCTNLSSVDFPECTSIGSITFGKCTSLTNVSLPKCTTMGSYAFSGCTSLTNVNLTKCTITEGYAFYGCTSLTSINLPACKTIGQYAFMSCYSLMSLRLGYASLVALSNKNAFMNTPMSNSTYTGVFGSIYVPASLVASYKTAANWSYYSSRITAIV